jgi:hypothetical protein
VGRWYAQSVIGGRPSQQRSDEKRRSPRSEPTARFAVIADRGGDRV